MTIPFPFTFQQNEAMNAATALQAEIGGAHTRFLFPERLRRALELTERFPQLRNYVGAVEAEDGTVEVSSGVLAQFLKLRRNSINKNLRDHGFVRGTLILPTRCEGGNLSWYKWTNAIATFGRSTLPSEIDRLANYAKIARKINSKMMRQDEGIEGDW
jgi:hypothetical protein